MHLKYKKTVELIGLFCAACFMLCCAPDRSSMKKMTGYLSPVLKLQMDRLEYGQKQVYLEGVLMEMVAEKVPVYTYSISYYGDGMTGAHYRQYSEILRQEARDEEKDNREDITKEKAQIKEHGESKQEEVGNTEEQVKGTDIDGKTPTGQLEVENEAGNEERLNQEDSVFIVTDGNQISKKLAYEESLLHTPLVKQIEEGTYADKDSLLANFFTIDNSTYIEDEILDGSKLLAQNMKVENKGEGPQILIYHTHANEAYADSVPGDASTTVVGVGDRLAEILEKEYGYKVLHHTGIYDLPNRDHAYSMALPSIEKLLQENPTIQVVIDLHRDAVAEDTHLVKKIGGKNVAQYMFFNGLSRVKGIGEIEYLPNQNLESNLAFSFQMQYASEKYYPGLARKIYLKGYRYNMHLMPRYLLIELGAQNNTLQEAMNACMPIARTLHMVLSFGGQ